MSAMIRSKMLFLSFHNQNIQKYDLVFRVAWVRNLASHIKGRT